MEYRVIALDMDGTALNDEKKFDERTKQAIHEALAAGKEVVFCSGRSYAEMEEPLKEFPDMNYLCGESGGLVFDLKKREPIAMISMTQEMIDTIEEVVGDRDIMAHFFKEGQAVVNEDQLSCMAHYQMGVYQESFLKLCTPVDQVFDYQRKVGGSVEKLNLYHTSTEEREKSLEMLQKRKLQANMTYSEIASLECTALGVDKAAGLQALCEKLQISMEQVIMVGDADNDCPALKAAGLAVAMGNANSNVKAISDVVVADNNHNGCGEAIYRFLLGREWKA